MRGSPSPYTTPDKCHPLLRAEQKSLWMTSPSVGSTVGSGSAVQAVARLVVRRPCTRRWPVQFPVRARGSKDPAGA